MEKKTHSILIVSGFFPYPPTHGGMIDVWKRLEGLYNLGYTIDLVYTSKETPNNEHLNYVNSFTRELFKVERKNKAIQLINKKPLQVVSRKGLQYVHIHKSYDYLILEGDYVGEIIKNKSIKYNNLIVRSHNNESLYFDNLSKSTNHLVKKIYYKLESLKFKKYSKTLYLTSTSIWFISKNEELDFNKKNKNHHTVWLPVPFAISEVKKQSLNTKTVLFIGSLFMENNIEAIKWYLNHIHTELIAKAKDYEFIIAGSLGDTTEKSIQKMVQGYKKVSLHLNRKDISSLYEQASVFINPMLHGAGVKVKSINAIINGLPLVSTTIGIEGIGLKVKEHFFLANTKEEFKNSILTVFTKKDKAQKMVNASQQYLIENNYITILNKELNECKKNL